GEVPYAGAQPFWLLFRRLEKVTRRKGGTLRIRYRSNGYTPNPKIAKKPQKQKTAPILMEAVPGTTLRGYRKTALICGLPAW
ncbi:hypothetical protein, partial [Pseudomonas sp. GW458-11-26-14-LB4]|uniref:hypothetical protein n=1 Tax=Pseudomonas sp. GW458-11-26-14-LB4 TaxID=2751356 RepID=UPI001A928755